MTFETRTRSRSRAESLADHAADKSNEAIEAARRAADSALDTLHDKVDALHDLLPGVFGRAAARVDDLTRRGMDRARQTGMDVRDRVGHGRDVTVAYVKDEPVKSILIAAAAGAALVMVAGMLTRRH